MNLLYISQNKLFLKEDGKRPQLVESDFARQTIETAVQSHKRNEWKSQGLSGQMMQNRRSMGGQEFDPTAIKVKFKGLATCEAQRIIYSLETDLVGGIFAYDLDRREEQRLFHSNRILPGHLSLNRSEGLIVGSARLEDGGSNLILIGLTGQGLEEITGGDTLDDAPSWAPGEGRKIVYQSAGIGRDENGHFAGIGPYRLEQIDLDQKEVTTLAEDDEWDYLLPKMDRQGRLYFIRRPHRGEQRPSPLHLILDFVLFPYRLGRAVFHFLDWFSMVFSKKSLRTAGGPHKEEPKARYLMLWGKMIDAEKVMKRKGANEDTPLVPKDWELRRRDANGAEETIAEGVLHYQLCDDGAILYTNGSAIFGSNGTRFEKICSDKMIEQMIATN